MSTWKRWSWRYRVGALFAFMMLLQGASCPFVIPDLAGTYTVPGIQGPVYGQRLTIEGRHYYAVQNDSQGSTRYIYEGSPEYQIIDNFFRAHPEYNILFFDRAGVPGGAGTLPAPAVQ